MTQQLSPATTAVVTAFRERYTETLRPGPFPDYWQEACLAVALRAAADQVVPDEPHPEESQFWDDEANREWQNNQFFRRQLLAIAAELEGAK